jgi:peptide chain release factor
MTIRKEKWEELRSRMETCGIREEDLVEKFILGSGSGGQKINKTASCVYLCHTPSGLEVKCQEERSRELNRFRARRRLCERYEEILLKEKSARAREIAKLRKQKQRRSRKTQAKLVEEKRRRSEVKEGRKPSDTH